MNEIEKLEKRVSRWGNHYQKYLFIIKKHQQSLTSTLESTGNMMHINLWRSSATPAEEMKIICDASDILNDTKKKIHNISCYYALQFLHINFRNLDLLGLGLTSRIADTKIYFNFIKNLGNDFIELTRTYLSHLLDIYLPQEKRPEFFLINVGTRVDQDDIDIGVITTDDADVTELNKAFQKIANNMLVYATPLHSYLTENVGGHIYTTTISEYKNIIELKSQHFIIVSELLNAEIILGSASLFEKFKKEIVAKYYYHPKRDVFLHERFLRGIVGEARALLIMPLNQEAISPKDDAIRILKSILTAKKTIHNIKEYSLWGIIPKLIRKEPDLRSDYELLYKAAAFLELFKFLLQMLLVQEETFTTDEIDNQQLSIIAEKMGYDSIGMVSSWGQLLTDYYRFVRQVREVCGKLINTISDHLTRVSVFKEIFKPTDGKNTPGNLATEFILSTHVFRGTKYWEDILYLLESDPEILNNFISGFEDLPTETEKEIIQQYIDWAKFSPTTMFRFNTILLKKQRNTLGDNLSKRMNLAFLESFPEVPSITRRICRIYSFSPNYIHEYLHFFPESQFIYFDQILDIMIEEKNLLELQRQLKELNKIYQVSSHYFQRFFYRVIDHHSEYIKTMTNSSELLKISSGFLALVDKYADYDQKKKLLGDYYDIEFVRVGIGALQGLELETTNLEFTEFCDNYIQKLFDVCREEVEHEDSFPLSITYSFAILVAGGHARGQAFDDDYDLIAVVDKDDEQVIKGATKIVARMNREIVKRGVTPHFRLGEILGSFVNPIPRIVEYLESDDPDSFIDLSQLLGARIVIGSDLMRDLINNQILNSIIFEKKSDYIQKMSNEINNRQASMKDKVGDSYNIKENRGGLRDIEAISLMIKCYLNIFEPLTSIFLRQIKTRIPDIAKELDIISDSLSFLRTIRNLYRITVAAEDDLQLKYFNRVASIYLFNDSDQWDGSQFLQIQIGDALNQSAVACDTVINYLNEKVS